MKSLQHHKLVHPLKNPHAGLLHHSGENAKQLKQRDFTQQSTHQDVADRAGSGLKHVKALPRLTMRPSLLLLLALLVAPGAAMAQKKIPKAKGHNQCPLGYVNTLGTTCVSPIYYQVAPTNGEACKEGWMNIGAGYCRKK